MSFLDDLKKWLTGKEVNVPALRQNCRNCTFYQSGYCTVALKPTLILNVYEAQLCIFYAPEVAVVSLQCDKNLVTSLPPRVSHELQGDVLFAEDNTDVWWNDVTYTLRKSIVLYLGTLTRLPDKVFYSYYRQTGTETYNIKLTIQTDSQPEVTLDEKTGLSNPSQLFAETPTIPTAYQTYNQFTLRVYLRVSLYGTAGDNVICKIYGRQKTQVVY